MFPILNETEEGMGVGVNTVAIPERPPTLLAPVSQAVSDYIPKVTESLQGAIGPIAQVPGVLAQGIYDPINKALTGQEMSVIDLPVPGAGAVAGTKRLVRESLTPAQQSLGITRRDRVVDVMKGPEGKTPELGYPSLGSQRYVDDMRADGVSKKDIEQGMSWYQKGKGVQLTLMGEEMMDTLAKTLFSPANKKLLDKYGIAPHIREDYERMLALDAEGLLGSSNNTRVKQLRNEMLSQLKYNLDVMIRRDPDNVPEIASMFYTNTASTTAKDLASSGIPIKKLFGDKLDMPVDAIRDHIGVFAAQSGSFGDKAIKMSGSRFSHLPHTPFAGPGSMTKKNRPDNVGRMAYDVIKDLPEGTPITLDNILKHARSRKWSDKRAVNIGRLRDESLDSGGYLSFGGRSLGEDRQYGHYNWRLIVDKKTGEGYMVMMDEMKLGLGVKPIDRALQAGGDESLGIDIVKLDKNMSAQGISLTGAPSHMESVPTIRKYVEEAKADVPTTQEQIGFWLKRVGQGIAATEGGRLAAYYLHSNKPAPLTGIEGDASP